MSPFDKQIAGARTKGIPSCLLFYALENYAGTTLKLFKLKEELYPQAMPQCEFMLMHDSIPRFKMSVPLDIRTLPGML